MKLRLMLAVKPRGSTSSPIGGKEFAKSCVGTLGFGSARETRHRRDWKDFEVNPNVELLITSQGNDPIPPPSGLSAECSVEDFLALTEPWNPNSFPEIQLVKKIVRVPTVIIGWEFLDGFWQTTQSLKRFSLQRSSVFQESEACNASSDRGQISRLWLNTLPLLESCAKEFKFIIDDPDSADFGWFRAPQGRFRPACTSRMLPTFPQTPTSRPTDTRACSHILSANFNHP